MIGALFLAATLVPAQPPKTEELPVLPEVWYGSWAGTLRITKEKGETEDVAMGMDIRPAPGGKYTFRITYGDGAKKQVRDYELVPKPGKPGKFEVDEKNGIRLECRLVGNALYTLFQVGDALIQSRYERAGDVLKVEMTAYGMKDPLATKPAGGGPEVRSPHLLSVQVAELKRVAEGK